MVDKAVTIRREKIGKPIDQIDVNALIEIERCLTLFLGIAK